jgi:hypothetical protein
MVPDVVDGAADGESFKLVGGEAGGLAGGVDVGAVPPGLEPPPSSPKVKLHEIPIPPSSEFLPSSSRDARSASVQLAPKQTLSFLTFHVNDNPSVEFVTWNSSANEDKSTVQLNTPKLSYSKHSFLGSSNVSVESSIASVSFLHCPLGAASKDPNNNRPTKMTSCRNSQETRARLLRVVMMMSSAMGTKVWAVERFRDFGEVAVKNLGAMIFWRNPRQSAVIALSRLPARCNLCFRIASPS